MECNRHDNPDSVRELKLEKLLQNNQMQKSEKTLGWELVWILDASYDWAFQFCMNIGATPIKIMTCIAGGPMPLPGKSPIVLIISSSSLSSSCTVGRNGGSLANLALIAER